MGSPDNYNHNHKPSEIVDIVKSWIPRRKEAANMSKDFWMPDRSCRVCYDCDSQFTLFNRRHHCRLCGRVFCAKCTANSVPAPPDEHNILLRRREDWERIRVCNYCLKQWEQSTAVVDTGKIALSPSPGLSPSPSATSLISSQSNCSGNSNSSVASTQYSTGPYHQVPYTTAQSPRKSLQMDPFRVQQDQLTCQRSSNTIADAGDSFPNQFDFCVNRSDDEDDGYGICGIESETGHFPQSDDYYGAVSYDGIGHLYGRHEVHPDAKNHDTKNLSSSLLPRSLETPELEGIKKVEEEGASCKNVDGCEVSPVYNVDSKVSEPVDFENNGLLWLPPEPEDEEHEREAVLCDEEEDDDATGDWGSLRSSRSFGNSQFHNKDRSSEEHRKAMKNVVDGHFRALVAQLLQVENLPLGEDDNKVSWLDIITYLCWEAATLLKPDTSKGGGMDPGGYVKVKCIACGCRTDSTVVKGVVCRKNVAHRRMASKIDKPRFLILGGALEYQRVSNHLSSFDTLLQQEMDHLKMAVAKIDAHHPNVLLVEKSVSRFAQEYLLAKNISLVLNIKRPLLERIARCTGAQIAPSIDRLTSQKIGHCDSFHVDKFFEEHGSAEQSGKKLTKTLMFFEGCPKPLGCTILLKGASGDELKRVKHVVQYGVFAAYHLALETSFLADEGASLPELPLKCPITVALPNKSLSIGRSISTIPGFIAPETQKPQPQGAHPFDESQRSKNNLSDFASSAIISPKWKSEVAQSTWLTEDPITQTLHSEPPRTAVESTGSLDSVSAPGHIFSDAYPNIFSPCHVFEENNNVGLKETLTVNIGQVLGDDNLTSNHFRTSELASSAQESNSNHGEVGSLREEFSPSPSDHQSILVSLTTRCVWKGTVCECAHLLRIKYYGTFDKPLGRFLRDHLFDQSYRCPSCEMPSEAHVHCYTHRQGSLTISVKKCKEFFLPGEQEGKIWMWHRCLRCPRTNGFPPTTRRVVMSDAAWGLSFGKFLELSFSNHAAASRVANCGHSLHRDCLRFYGFGRTVACFHYASIDVHSVYLPPPKLEFNYDNQDWIRKEADEIRSRADLLFAEVYNAVRQISEGTSLDSGMKAPESRKRVAELAGMLQKEKEEFEESVQQALNREVKVGQPAIDILEINKLRRQLLFHSYIWDQHLIYSVSLNSKSVQEGMNSSIAKPKEKSVCSSDRPVEMNATSKPGKRFSSFSSCDSFLLDGKPDINLNQWGSLCMTNQPNEIRKGEDMDHDLDCREAEVYLSSGRNMTDQTNNMESVKNVRRVLSEGQFPIMENLSATLDAAWTGENHPGGITPKENGREYANKVMEGSSDVVDSVAANSDLKNRTDDQDGAKVAHSLGFSVPLKEQKNSMSWVGMPFLNFYHSLNKNSSLNAQIVGKVSEYNPVYVKSFWEMVRQGGARLLLPVGVNDTVLPVYDDEPTSIISYALLSPDYHTQISNEPERPKDGVESSVSSLLLDSTNLLSLNSFDNKTSESFRSLGSTDESSLSMSGSRGSSVLDPLLFTKASRTIVSFTDDGPLGNVKYTVTCYYAKRFEALRRICCPSELDFIRSLSRCRKWGAQGGKSNVFFAKTLDDRFIIKQVTKTELESFIKFAPAYFKYLSESISSRSPTCLAKILGIYQVTSKHLKGGKESRIDVLVMENLLFGRNVTRLYDLKGSSRSRYNPDASGSNKVLLDQNLIEAMPTSPIFVGNQAKRLLERAVWNDTAFLASIDVMDYSLLVGVDEEKHELVLGIIDFMRQYTWDKHLETWVKASGILGGPKNTPPTVISPMQYKKRFRKAMAAYFIMVPDQRSPPPTIIASGSQSDLCGEENSQGGASLD
ncbi:1-phosphatidylinositol-3-phosphate 5-kinase FAB1B-like isoform X1 [Camellia sinensis]|uniref:1-phosphatidylinositol-3-phosphate 5-kinase FAB1B-like isoform X1 n=1 Tax=Camellia sinensis TaxID=4442 RepID=UPI0010365160|nr:1-phosphatidylinositol-3-phosphate 5-kinase FAB1B-like isoform X1 [Camellia sinensis]